MIKSFGCVLLLLIAVACAYGQGVSFQYDGFEQIAYRAKQSDKPIFVDVYTDWCLPCKKMDKLVFVDSLVGSYFNAHYTSLKSNAEDGGSGHEVATKYSVGSYPTYLFLHPDGSELMRYSGFLSVPDLLTMAREAHHLFKQYHKVRNVQNRTLETLSDEEVQEVLFLSRRHFFPGKLDLIHRYLNDRAVINEDDLALIMGNINDLDLGLLGRITPLTTGLSDVEISVRRNPAERMRWKNDTQNALLSKIRTYTNKADFSGFNQTMDILRTVPNIRKKEIDWMYYDFYRTNDLDHYKVFATYMIDEYLLKTSPEKVEENDRVKHRVLHINITSVPDETKTSDFGSALSSGTNGETPGLDSIEQIRTLGQHIANKLYEISGDFYAFYGDPLSLQKASIWAELAYKYFPYDLKLYENHITILYKIGDKARVAQVKRLYESMPLYPEMKLRKEQKAQATTY